LVEVSFEERASRTEVNEAWARLQEKDDDDDNYFRPVGPPEGYKDVLS
jgi:hypothetical protein